MDLTRTGGCRDQGYSWLTLVPTVCVALVLAVCAGHDEFDDAGNINVDGVSVLANYNEDDFADSPDLRANPDDIVTLQLEDEAGGSDDTLDTGDTGGDVVPYNFLETAERTFCWEVAGDGSATGSGSAMRLIDDETGAVMLQVEEGGDCVTRTIPAGNYSAHFNHGPDAEQERDLVFIVPQSAISALKSQDSRTSVGQNFPADGDAFGATNEPTPTPTATPYCPFAVITGPDYVPPFVPAAGVRRQVLEGVSFQYVPAGGCNDISLIRDTIRTPFNDIFELYPLTPNFTTRLYAERFFRGPRKTIPAGTPAIRFVGPGSMVLLHADQKQNLDWLIFSNGCIACDLSGLSLDKVDLSGAWLHQADLSHASLKGANLSNVQALQTVFKSAYLEGADLHDADLSGATFDSTGPVEDDSGQVYAAADLSGANLTGAILKQTILTGATLTNATLAKVTAEGADFTGVSAAEAKFQDAKFLNQTILRNAILTNATLTGVSAAGIDFTGISAAGADFQNATLTSAVLTSATLSRARFDKADLRGANLQNASLDEAWLPEADLRGAFLNRERALQGAFLDEAYMYNAKLNNADLTGVSMRGAKFYGLQALAQSARFDLARLDGAVLSGANFTQASFLSATLDGAACVNCQFNNAVLGATASDFSDAASFVGTDVRGADFTNATVDGCRFTDALVSLVSGGTYTYSAPGHTLFTTGIRASVMGAVRTSATVRCPDRSQGPCNTDEKLTARPPTPTMTPRPPTPTPAAGCTPNIPRGIYCPTRTPVPVP